ncbi:hypothetical protein ACFFK0_07420 [Paenibacillus chartarius]|uniref:Flp pilus-assembly TadG-like N-terminal domain-containing protein n=1 Tax=Paenibacillus chartarius TaxID=747481 RepID=A0ABV6DI39_9BACL
MYKLLLFFLMSVVLFMMYALQTDEELAMFTLFQGKRGLNHAVHAAAQQSDAAKLARGIHSIDEAAARSVALEYLQQNLQLDSNMTPLPGTFLRSQVELVDWTVINENETFPFTYMNTAYGYTVTLQRPGVVAIVRLSFPRTYNVLGPITWTIKSSAEMVY